MGDPMSLHPVDWAIIGLYMAGTMIVGLYFTRRAGRDMDSFFVSGRSLPWYLAGVSMIATSFASDTPLWVSSLVRQYGVHYVWQYWAPAIGSALGIVLFARLWRRLAVLTDNEFLEMRYPGRLASALRFWSGFSAAVFFCPLVIGWVVKAMEVITREMMGLPPEYRIYTTIAVMIVALISCALSGLWGVVYTDFFQFVLSLAGTIALAVLAVKAVGGLGPMVERLNALDAWPGRSLAIAPTVGSGAHQMSVWNAVGYFGILWLTVALSGGYQAQRILACRSTRDASYAMLLHTAVYYALICWPWILVGLCSILLLPDLGGSSHDAAYPRMMLKLLPIGLRGLMVAAMLAAFMSTISTLFNWGSSYLLNDIYRRFLVRHAADRHYVHVGRLATVFMAFAGALISLQAANIQQLLTIAYVVGTGPAVVGILRWFWPRLTAAGDLTAVVAAWVVTPFLLFPCGFKHPIFDAPARWLMGWEANLSDDPNLLGARMSFIVIVVTLLAVTVSLCTRPTPDEHLRAFLLKARPFRFCWRSVIRRLDLFYVDEERPASTLVSWILAMGCVYGLLFGIGKLLLGAPVSGAAWLMVSGVTLLLTIRRVRWEHDAAGAPDPPAGSAMGDDVQSTRAG